MPSPGRRSVFNEAMSRVEQYLALPSETARRAALVSARWSPPSIHRHSVRSWVLAALLGDSLGYAYDPELLCVASLLHDLALTAPFDAHETAFEVSGGAVGAVFALGAGWSSDRADRVAAIIEAHMQTSVDPDVDLEGHLLESSTSIDVAGVGMDLVDAADLAELVARSPRGDFAETFAAAVHTDAARKPGSNAARLDGSGRIAQGESAWSTL